MDTATTAFASLNLSVPLNTIINVLLIAILVICAWQGYKKGIIMSIVQVLCIVLSLYGAQLLSDTFSYEIIPVLKPFVSGFMDSELEVTTYQAFGYTPDETGKYDVPYSMTDMINSDPGKEEEIVYNTYKNLGLYERLTQSMTEKTMNYVNENNATVSSAVTTISCQSISWYGGFLIAFIMVFSILTVIVNLPNLSFKIPYVGIVNDIGGIAIGLFSGALLCSLVVWVFNFAGLVLPEADLRATGVANFFLTRDLLSNYISL